VTDISLGYTALRETDKEEIIVPDSVMGSSVIIRLNASDVSSPDAL
jgi:small-conductance mechanosensitive channel